MRNRYKAVVLKVIDATSFEALVELGFGHNQKFQVHLEGLKAEDPEQAQDFLTQLIEARNIILFDAGHEKYGKAFAKVKLENGSDLTKRLVEQNIGFDYHDGKKQTKCLIKSS